MMQDIRSSKNCRRKDAEVPELMFLVDLQKLYGGDKADVVEETSRGMCTVEVTQIWDIVERIWGGGLKGLL